MFDTTEGFCTIAQHLSPPAGLSLHISLICSLTCSHHLPMTLVSCDSLPVTSHRMTHLASSFLRTGLIFLQQFCDKIPTNRQGKIVSLAHITLLQTCVYNRTEQLENKRWLEEKKTTRYFEHCVSGAQKHVQSIQTIHSFSPPGWWCMKIIFAFVVVVVQQQ